MLASEDLKSISEKLLPSIENLPKLHFGDLRQQALVLEGQLGAAYWNCLACIFPPELAFPGRRYQHASDPINSCLNYGYGILYSYGAAAIDLAGLDPFAGFYHVDRSGRESLVLDFIELFRSAWIDRGILSLMGRGWRPQIEDGYLTEDTRKEMSKSLLLRLDNRVSFQSKNYRFQSVMAIQSRNLASFIRGERQSLDVFTAPW